MDSRIKRSGETCTFSASWIYPYNRHRAHVHRYCFADDAGERWKYAIPETVADDDDGAGSGAWSSEGRIAPAKLRLHLQLLVEIARNQFRAHGPRMSIHGGIGTAEILAKKRSVPSYSAAQLRINRVREKGVRIEPSRSHLLRRRPDRWTMTFSVSGCQQPQLLWMRDCQSLKQQFVGYGSVVLIANASDPTAMAVNPGLFLRIRRP